MSLSACQYTECTYTVLQLGLDALNKNGVIASLEPVVELQFQKTKSVIVYCKLRRRDVPDVMLDRYITVINKDKVSIKVL